MTKSETRELIKLTQAHKLGMSDYVARGLSALIRAARTARSAQALTEHADILSVRQHPEFII